MLHQVKKIAKDNTNPRFYEEIELLRAVKEHYLKNISGKANNASIPYTRSLRFKGNTLTEENKRLLNESRDEEYGSEYRKIKSELDDKHFSDESFCFRLPATFGENIKEYFAQHNISSELVRHGIQGVAHECETHLGHN